jgi:hypothetical protein
MYVLRYWPRTPKIDNLRRLALLYHTLTPFARVSWCGTLPSDRKPVEVKKMHKLPTPDEFAQILLKMDPASGELYMRHVAMSIVPDKEFIKAYEERGNDEGKEEYLSYMSHLSSCVEGLRHLYYHYRSDVVSRRKERIKHFAPSPEKLRRIKDEFREMFSGLAKAARLRRQQRGNIIT